MIRIIDTRTFTEYAPLSAAIEAICTAKSNEKIAILVADPDDFHEIKCFLSAHKMGFREIYKEDFFRIELTVK